MKKGLLGSFVCLLATAANLFGMETPQTAFAEEILNSLDSFVQIECPIQEITRRQSSMISEKQISHETGTHDHGSAPHLSLGASTSTNWCGYAAATDLSFPRPRTVNAVAGTWTVPTLLGPNPNGYSAVWVGIDGFTSPTVEQIGTESDWINGAQVNYAWFDMFPRGSFQIIGFPVNNGDVITGIVTHITGNSFQLILLNFTQNVFTIIPSVYTKLSGARRSSAEWIVEAPTDINGNVLPLANFGTLPFMNSIATIRGVTGPINDPSWQNDAITMVTPSNTTKAAPSALSPDGSSFTATWVHP